MECILEVFKDVKESYEMSYCLHILLHWIVGA